MPQVELTVTVGTGWTYIGNGEALRLRAIAGGCAIIEIGRADIAFPDPAPRAALNGDAPRDGEEGQ